MRVEPSKSTDLTSGENNKAKKSEGKKLKPKTELTLLTPSFIQTQSILVSLKSSDTNKEEFCVLHKKIVKRNIKNIANMKNILKK